MDTYYYWCHRFLHLRLPYRYIHKMHHRVHVPYCSAGFYLHPAEVLLLDQGAAFVAATLFPSMRFWTVLILQLLLPIRACHEHLGYVFPWDIDNSGLGTQKVTHHGIHHQPAGHKFNYSTPFFTFMAREPPLLRCHCRVLTVPVLLWRVLIPRMTSSAPGTSRRSRRLRSWSRRSDTRAHACTFLLFFNLSPN